MNGDSAAGTITLPTRPCHLTAEAPAAAMVAPTTPPIRACEELEGMPRYQVARFHRMEPVRPAMTTVRVTSWLFTRPLAMVAATAVDRNAPTRFSTAEMATATRGGRAPVTIEVAIALPVSWNPLVKSNPSAVTTTSTRTTSLPVTYTNLTALPTGSGQRHSNSGRFAGGHPIGPPTAGSTGYGASPPGHDRCPGGGAQGRQEVAMPGSERPGTPVSTCPARRRTKSALALEVTVTSYQLRQVRRSTVYPTVAPRRTATVCGVPA